MRLGFHAAMLFVFIQTSGDLLGLFVGVAWLITIVGEVVEVVKERNAGWLKLMVNISSYTQ